MKEDNKLSIVMKEYSGWEDCDANNTEIVGIYDSREKAYAALEEQYNSELEWFKMENMEVVIDLKRKSTFAITRKDNYGEVRGYIVSGKVE